MSSGTVDGLFLEGVEVAGINLEAISIRVVRM